jgi:hypothetical protein
MHKIKHLSSFDNIAKCDSKHFKSVKKSWEEEKVCYNAMHNDVYLLREDYLLTLQIFIYFSGLCFWSSRLSVFARIAYSVDAM